MDELWIQQMGVDNLTGGRNQPFYNVLGDDCKQRYAAQGKLWSSGLCCLTAGWYSPQTHYPSHQYR